MGEEAVPSERKPSRRRRAEAAEQIWLDYYNRILYRRGLITEREYSRMAQRIARRRTP